MLYPHHPPRRKRQVLDSSHLVNVNHYVPTVVSSGDTSSDLISSPVHEDTCCTTAQLRGCVKVLSNNAFSSFYLLPPHFLAVWSNTVICTHVMLPAVSVPAAPVGVLTVSPTVITFQCPYPLSVIYTSFRYSALRALHYSSSGVLGHSTLLYTSSSSLLFSTFRVLFCFTLRVLSFIGLRYVPLC